MRVMVMIKANEVSEAGVLPGEKMLAEMAAALPSSGSFSTYADRAIGRWAGFSVGWLYWWFWVLVIPVEATAAAKILNAWVPSIDQWAWALIVTVLQFVILERRVHYVN